MELYFQPTVKIKEANIFNNDFNIWFYTKRRGNGRWAELDMVHSEAFSTLHIFTSQSLRLAHNYNGWIYFSFLHKINIDYRLTYFLSSHDLHSPCKIISVNLITTCIFKNFEWFQPKSFFFVLFYTWPSSSAFSSFMLHGIRCSIKVWMCIGDWSFKFPNCFVWERI